MAKIKLSSLEDCNKLIEKRVSFKYHGQTRTGVVKEHYTENRAVWFKVLSDATKVLTHVNMRSLIETTNVIVKS